MSSEQKFDRIFRNKVEGGENDIPFSDAGWESARKMIDAERGAGIATVKNVSVVLAMILLLGIGVAVTVNVLGAERSVAQLKEMKHIKTGVSPAEVLENKLSAEDNIQMNVTGITADQMVHTTEIESNIPVNAKSPSGLTNAPGHKTTLTTETSPVTGSKKSSASKENRTGDFALKASNSNSQRNRKSKQEIVNPEILKSQTKANDEYEVYENTQNAFWLSGKITSFPESNLDSSLVKTPFDFIRVYDVDYYKAKRRKTHYLNIEAGMAYMMGWNAPKGKDAKGFNAYAGINAGVYLGKKSSISAGVQLYNIGNIQQPFFNGSNVSYDFGANGTYTVLSGKSLYYTAIPLHFNYSLKGSDRISVGVNTGILCGGVNSEETFEMQDGIKMNHEVQRSVGYYEGMNPVNIMATAGYGRNVSKRLRMNAEVLYGLSDIYKSTKFNQTKERIPGIRIGMQYTIADK